MNMYPELVNNFKTKSEEEVYQKLQKNCPDEWVGIYSWKIDLPNYNHEIDFIILVPQRGIFVLEVKGGNIICRNRSWYVKDDKR